LSAGGGDAGNLRADRAALNFANIVALPLLLALGVAFKIYYVTAWRSGRTNLLQSSLTRAIFFSALTTATAFGSLWLSSHPGTASMGSCWRSRSSRRWPRCCCSNQR